jgi:processed acidic surface protein
MDEALLTELLTMLDVTDAELINLEAYFTSLEGYYADPAFLEAFNSWTDRISFLEELDGAQELGQEQASQIAAYFNELFSLLRINPVISFIRDDKETMISFEDLALMKDFDYTMTDLKVTIYGTDGTLLADYFVTSDFIEYLSELYGEIPEKLEEITTKPVTQSKDRKPSAPKTVSGGKLPKTAANHIPGAILGGILMIIGILMYKKVFYVKKDTFH